MKEQSLKVLGIKSMYKNLMVKSHDLLVLLG